MPNITVSVFCNHCRHILYTLRSTRNPKWSLTKMKQSTYCDTEIGEDIIRYDFTTFFKAFTPRE